jgi:CheY-like chemotaxis protein
MDSGARATPEQMQRQHIFVVNGSVEFLDIVRELLQEEDYNVTTTNFVPRTFHQIETARPSLLVVDLCHGEQAGWDLLTELRQEAATQQIPVILVSTSKQYLERAAEEQAIGGGRLPPQALRSGRAAADDPGVDRGRLSGRASRHGVGDRQRRVLCCPSREGLVGPCLVDDPRPTHPTIPMITSATTGTRP